MEKIGSRLKELRKKKNLTLREVGEYLKFTPTTISCYESGTRKPSHEVIAKLAKLYETTTDYIVSAENENASNIKYILNSKKLHWDGIPLEEEELELIKHFLELSLKRKHDKTEKSSDDIKSNSTG